MTVTINGTTGYSGPVGTIGDLTTTGNTTLGDASGDTLTINGSTTTLTQGTANGVAYLNGSKVLTTGSALVFDGSNLGIGTSSPDSKLHVVSGASSTLAQLRIGYNGTSVNYYDANTHYFRDGSGPTTRMTIDSSGNLGLGVTPTNNTLGKTLQVGQAGAWVAESGTNRWWLANNWYYNAGDKYINNGYATIYSQQTGTHQWLISASGTAGNTISFTQAMTLDASGNLLLGTTSQEYNGKIIRTDNSNSAIQSVLIRNNNAGSSSSCGFFLNCYGNSWAIEMGSTAKNSNALTFSVDALGSPSEKMRLDTSGNLLVGTTTVAQTLSTNNVLTLKAPGVGAVWGVGPTSSYGTFYISRGGTGVALSDGATSWGTVSDERTKDIIEPITNAAEKVAGLRAVIGKYKTDVSGVRRSFLIAQDIQAVLPEAIDVGEDADNTLSVKYTEVIPLLVAAIKELKAEFDAYKLTHP